LKVGGAILLVKAPILLRKPPILLVKPLVRPILLLLKVPILLLLKVPILLLSKVPILLLSKVPILLSKVPILLLLKVPILLLLKVPILLLLKVPILLLSKVPILLSKVPILLLKVGVAEVLLYRTERVVRCCFFLTVGSPSAAVLAGSMLRRSGARKLNRYPFNSYCNTIRAIEWMPNDKDTKVDNRSACVRCSVCVFTETASALP
jgi:hypothetical protein